MEKRFWAIIAAIVLIFAGIMWYSNRKEANESGNTIQPTNHLKGKTDSKVKLVEYGDFQCPACGSYYPVVGEILKKYDQKISFQFRNLPLTQIHQHAFAAARAAEAADKQGKFWEMYDMLFANQQSWSPTTQPVNYFDQYATTLGLNSEQFKKDFASAEVNKLINADVSAFKKTGNSLGTPSFFLNGKKIDLKQISDENSRPSYEKFTALIDAELKKQGQE
jgi:protein-disulfide isomerase